jgi:spore coat polysaccharide biosynthesis predicted glycosyltransferase SpsG
MRYVWEPFPVHLKSDLVIYQSALVQDTGDDHTLSGLDYIILNPALIQARDARPQLTKDYVLVSFGGSDPHQLSGTVCRFIQRHIDLPIKLVVGPAMGDFAIPEGIQLVYNPPDLVTLLASAKCLVGSLGMTTYEADLVGVPQAVVSWTLDHLQTAIYLEEQLGMVANLGQWDNVNWDALRTFLNDVDKGYLDDDGSWGYLDGLGVGRVADRIEALL